jgi:hypothetical protein
MSKEKFAEIIKEEPQPQREQSTLAKILEGAKDIGGAIWDGAARHAEHGSAELMSAAYTGNSYVPYGWSKVDAGQEQEAAKTNEGHGLPEAAKEQERGGRE